MKIDSYAFYSNSNMDTHQVGKESVTCPIQYM